ncbi:MAG: type II toxin-antitoxin system death-on-curing family toxin [Chitinophagaceae bacterium]|nr:type II toxin-antitoxin system death-on-curing family toxin [Chitinophagaceae bacterium]
MISLEDVLLLHELSIKDYGGASGVRDIGLLESAIARPYQTFGVEELYPDAIQKAAAIAESLIINHPFVDGNKRTGMLAMYAILKEDNLKITASSDDLYKFIISISTGEKRFEDIVVWLHKNTIPA